MKVDMPTMNYGSYAGEHRRDVNGDGKSSDRPAGGDRNTTACGSASFQCG